jgi:hypothetical protein
VLFDSFAGKSLIGEVNRVVIVDKQHSSV